MNRWLILHSSFREQSVCLWRKKLYITVSCFLKQENIITAWKPSINTVHFAIWLKTTRTINTVLWFLKSSAEHFPAAEDQQIEFLLWNFLVDLLILEKQWNRVSGTFFLIFLWQFKGSALSHQQKYTDVTIDCIVYIVWRSPVVTCYCHMTSFGDFKYCWINSD